MISHKTRESKRARPPKMSKNIERLYREGKCSECSVIVTRMDFAKILGKFTKVKIQYESGSPRTRRGAQQTTPTNSRLKSNENGMVHIHRNAYNQHPADLLKTSKANEKTVARLNNIGKERKANEISTPRVNNILKENNRLKKTSTFKNSNNHLKPSIKSSKVKRYGIIFTSPKISENENIMNHNILLSNILPSIDKGILPSSDWCIDYLPKQGDPKDDKVYDRIAAELEDLMNNEKSIVNSDSKTESGENKDDFPSIMDILNDNTDNNSVNNQTITIVQANLESSDVEAMLLGKNETIKISEPAAMEVDSSVINNLLNDVQMSTATQEDSTKAQNVSDIMDNPNSPSILDEALQKDVEENLPKAPVAQDSSQVVQNAATDTITDTKNKEFKLESNTLNQLKSVTNEVRISPVTHVVFKKCTNGICSKSVTCPKNLKYSVELEGKPVEFLGAPKFITCKEDLQVLLQIVNETKLNSLYVLH